MEVRDVVAIADEAFALARRRNPEWIACRAGCDTCCRTPFAITREDALRLRTGWRELPSGVAAAVQERADAAWRRMGETFPGEAATGELTGEEAWREWFFRRQEGLACPALEESTGACLLYAHRPFACRVYGPLITINGQASGPCPLCYAGASAADVERSAVSITVPEEAPEAETVIAFALSSSFDR